MKQFLNTFKNYFEISTYERRGVFTLLFCVIMVIVYHYVKNNIVFHAATVTQEEIDELNALAAESFTKKEDYYAQSGFSSPAKKTTSEKPISAFDPNTDSYSTLVNKGLPAYVAKNIVNFRAKGGVYRTKNDLAKLYVIDDNTFRKLEPFIEIKVDEKLPLVETTKIQKEEVETAIQVELNRATKDQLMQVKGIGNYYADKIIKQRDALGGFADLTQVQQLFAKHPEGFEKIQRYITVDPGLVAKIAINRATFDELRKHPLFSFNQAKGVVNYIEQHGSIDSFEALNQLHVFRGKDIGRLKPYIDFK